jgi:hypothetical protein
MGTLRDECCDVDGCFLPVFIWCPMLRGNLCDEHKLVQSWTEGGRTRRREPTGAIRAVPYFGGVSVRENNGSITTNNNCNNIILNTNNVMQYIKQKKHLLIL